MNTFKKALVKTPFAFTLAEVLITLGIIGVIAALTIPSLINSTRNLQFKVAAKKTYAGLTNAVEKASLDNGGNFANLHTSFSELLNLLIPYFMYSKVCATNVATENCLANDYKYLDGSPADSSWMPEESGFVLNDGAVITGWANYSSTCTYAYSASLNNVCASLLIDVNGIKPPNQFGVDTFIAYLTTNKIVPAGADGAEGKYPDHYCATYGFSCLQKVLTNTDY